MTEGASPGSRTRNAEADLPEWSLLYRRCVHAARRLGGARLDAEDLAQEAMAQLLSALPGVDRPGAWLHAVVHNLVRRHQRRRADRARVHSELAGQRHEVPSPAARHAAELDLFRALARLSPRSRRLLELVLAGHTHREIAAVMECEIHQVGPRIKRALQTARRRLGR